MRYATLLLCAALTSYAHAVSTQTLLDQGQADLQKGNYNGAIRMFSQAVVHHKDSATYFLLGYAHYQRGFRAGVPASPADTNDVKEAVKAYTTALKLDPKLSGVRQPHVLYYGLGLSYETLSNPTEALKAYKKAMTAAPHDPLMPLYAARLRYQLAETTACAANLQLALMRARQTQQEETVVDILNNDSQFSAMMNNPANQRVVEETVSASAVALNISNTDDGFGLRDAISDRARASLADPKVTDKITQGDGAFSTRNWDEAATAYQQALSRDKHLHSLPVAAQAAINQKIGVCYNSLNRPNEAVPALERALKIAPFSAEAHYQMALAHATAGRSDAALKALKDTFFTAATDAERRRYRLLIKTDHHFATLRARADFRELLLGPLDSQISFLYK